MKPIVITEKYTNSKDNKILLNYFNDVSKFEPFETPEKEYECAIKAYEGDEKSKEELLKRNLRFVISVAKQYVDNTDKGDLLDLISVGNIGLKESIDSYEPNRGFKLISYAVWHIRKEIISYKNNNKTIRLPYNILNSLYAYNKFSDNNLHKDNYGLNIDDLPKDKISTSKKNLKETISSGVTNINSTEQNVGEDFKINDILSIESNVDGIFENNDMKIIVNSLLSKLKTKEYDVMVRHFGLNGFEPKTKNTISSELGISTTMINSIINRSVNKLKHHCRINNIKTY